MKMVFWYQQTKSINLKNSKSTCLGLKNLQKVFLCFTHLRPRLRLGLQSLGLAQEDSLLLLMI
jgi:hypothetical protein